MRKIMQTVYTFTIHNNTSMTIYKRCSFEWDLEKYSTRPMNKVYCIFPYRTQMNNVYIFSHDQVTHDITSIDCSSNYS